MENISFIYKQIKLAVKRQHTLRQGFTLIEVAIVILVIGIMASIILVSISPKDVLDSAKALQVKTQSKDLEIHLQRYEIENESLEEGAELSILAQNADGWRAIKEESTIDPWRRAYFLCSDNAGVRQICSYGADGTAGGTGVDTDFYLTDKSSWPKWLAPKNKN